MSVKAPAPKRNATVAHAQSVTAHFATARKQSGRRYGPPPKKAPRTAPPAPLAYAVRLDNYHTQNGAQYVTDRQYRQLSRMAALHEPTACTDLRREAFAKGYATPKQQKPVRQVAR